jgi:hypothetical protein
MKSPFPGMDPYLERYWGDVHGKLITYAADQLNTVLPDDLVARSSLYVALSPDSDGQRQGYFPDVGVREQPGGETDLGPEPSAVAVAEPVVLRMPASKKRRRIVIGRIDDETRLVTAIEFLSPSNKIGDDERESYRERRRGFLAHGVNYVEIDLIRSGGYVLYPDETLMTGSLSVPYRTCVIRPSDLDRVAVYPMSLREKLPAFRIPLRPTDREAVLNLQPLVEQVYQNGKYGRTIDYAKDPDPKVAGEDAVWADGLLKAAGKR